MSSGSDSDMYVNVSLTKNQKLTCNRLKQNFYTGETRLLINHWHRDFASLDSSKQLRSSMVVIMRLWTNLVFLCPKLSWTFLRPLSFQVWFSFTYFVTFTRRLSVLSQEALILPEHPASFPYWKFTCLLNFAILNVLRNYGYGIPLWYCCTLI